MKRVEKKIYVIINPVSGVKSKEKVPDMILSRCQEAGISAHVIYTEYAGHAGELTRKAVDEGIYGVVAVGGDGTINEIAQNLLHTDVVLGIIPKGSGNGLARELGIPMDTRGAVDVIFSENILAIDACLANDKVFFCTCGVGFDATISAKFAEEKRRGSLTYLKNIVEQYLNYRPEVYELSIDEHTIKEKAFLITCANASQYGNNAYIAPLADICDGQMDVTILSPFTPLDIGPLAVQLFTKTLNRNNHIKTFQTKEARIIRQKAGVMHLDGEPVMASEEINVSVLQAAIRVFTPSNIESLVDIRYRFDEKIIRFFNRIPTSI